MALVCACGSSSTDEGANTGAVAPATGTSGAPAASGGGGTPGMVPGLMMSTVACGTASCQGLMFGGMGATPCCADEAMGTCGTMMGATCMAKPAVAEKCPKIPPVFGMTVNSCCQADGTCGVDGSAVGRGCGPYSGLAMFMIAVPPATMCDGTPIAGGAAGASAGAAGASAGAAGASAGAAGGQAAGGAAGKPAGAAGGGAAAAGSSASAGGAGKAAAGTSGGTAGSTSSSGTAGKAGSAASAGAGGR